MEATKERIIARRQVATERYILSTLPVLYLPLWKRDSGGSGGTLLSDDGRGFPATVTGATLTQKGRNLDGADDLITLGSPTEFNLQQLSLEVWFKLDTVTGSQYLVGNGGLQLNTKGYIMSMGAATLYFETDDDAGPEYATTITGLTTGLWYHAIGTSSLTFNTLYLNGLPSTPVARTKTMTWANAFNIGKAPVNAAYWTFGTVGEVRIYPRQLSWAEVRRNYEMTKWRYQ